MTKQIKIGNIYIGGGQKIAIQSMTTVPTSNALMCAEQINRLAERGCDIVRVAVNSAEDAAAIRTIKDKVSVPVVADIQFDFRLAIASIENGADKIRINPGNIGSLDKIKAVADCLKAHRVPVRVGVNSGSIQKTLLQKYGKSAEALCRSALENVKLLENFGISDIVISVKSSSVKETVEACRLINKTIDYPQHLGVTEAGTYDMAIVKSSIGIGALLLDGIGDTIRVSVTGDPEKEPVAARNILRAIGLDKDFVEIISCPTCSRCTVDLAEIAEEVQKRTAHIKKPLKVAVMGCAVNGPGEARAADAGIAFGHDRCALFLDGKVIKTISAQHAVFELINIIQTKLL